MELIRPSSPNAWAALGGASTDNEALVVYSPTAGATDTVAWSSTKGNGGVSWPGALSGIAVGQHFTLEIIASGGSVDLLLDGVSQGAVTKTYDHDHIIGAIGAYTDGLNAGGTDSALQNVVIKDLTAGLTYGCQ